MKKIWYFLKHHLSADFNLNHYTCVFALLVAGIVFNYSVDFEDDFLDRLQGFQKFFAYLGFYSFFYLVSIYSYCYWNDRRYVFKNADFWLHSIFGLSVLSLDSSVPFLLPVIEQILPVQVQLWSYKVATNMVSFFTVLIPIVIFYFIREYRDKSVYGIRSRHFDPAPYLTMLLIMLPLIVVASYHASFLRQYPMYRGGGAHNYMGVGEWVTVSGYEIAYGLDFITVELLFRGFLVIGMLTFLGRGTVLTMAVVYCTLHFGKPMGEAISSVFGGYILGVIAFETRSIWGGIIVHMGIAWIMELVAFVQKSGG
jgi:hypothetical protein